MTRFNRLRKRGDEQVTKALLFLKNIYNLEDEPNDAKAYKEERHNACS
jgi:hypothetical protein